MKQLAKQVLCAVTGLVILALPVYAQQPNPAPELFVSFRSNDFIVVAIDVMRLLLGVVGVVSLFYIIWGGFQYLTSGLNSDLAERGKKTIRNAIVGLIIVILSYIIVTVVVNTLYNRIPVDPPAEEEYTD